MIAIVDYGVGNIFSLYSSFNYIGADVILTNDKNKIRDCDKIVLPGVGAFGDAIDKLRKNNMDEFVIGEANKGKPLLGICLGMQLLFEKSFEFGEHKGLGLIKGDIRPIKDIIPIEYKIPHIGWNKLQINDNPIFKYINNGDYVYFVHSYYGTNCNDSTIATTDYGAKVTACVCKDNVFGMQFHPEKSGNVGINILKSFSELKY